MNHRLTSYILSNTLFCFFAAKAFDGNASTIAVLVVFAAHVVSFLRKEI